MKKENLNIKFPSPSLIAKKYRGFTLAEILLSLSIIGIVAAIALPSLLGNVHERAFETQKKALYTRFSQALPLLPSLNGYGELYEREKTGGGKELVDTAAETFVRDGLSKVMKITNICDSEHLSDCGLPEKIIPINGGSALGLSNILDMGNFNASLISQTNTGGQSYSHLNTKAAAFETVNGESILVYYNPDCEANLDEYELDYVFAQAKMCANFVYDLNGKKGPNTVGKDVGFISALYSTSPVVVAPIPYPTDIEGTFAFDSANEECKNMSTDAKLPNIDELSSLYYNKIFLGLSGSYWSNTLPHHKKNYAWAQGTGGGRYAVDISVAYKIRCIKR